MSRQVSLPGLAETLRTSDDFVICGHVSPDGDCLGSQFALAAALRAMGKRATCLLANHDPIAYPFMQLPGMSEAVVAGDYHGEVGTFVTVDVPTAERMGRDAAALHAAAPCTATIDHHLSPGVFSDVSYVDPDCPANAMIVWELIGHLGVSPTPEMATCCYVGLMTDTGRFQYQNTTAEAFAFASEMIAAGANPSELAKLVYQNRSRESLAIEQRLLSQCEFPEDGNFVLGYLLVKDFAETGASRSDTEDLIDVLRGVRGVRVACLLKEQESTVRASLRAKDDTDVAAIAQRMGGGGHKAAAGFTFEGTIEQSLAMMRSVFDELGNA